VAVVVALVFSDIWRLNLVGGLGKGSVSK
jgi:hypothetical protein